MNYVKVDYIFLKSFTDGWYLYREEVMRSFDHISVSLYNLYSSVRLSISSPTSSELVCGSWTTICAGRLEP